MNASSATILNHLEQQLRFLNLEMEDSIQIAETAIEITLKSIEKLKSNILKYKFSIN